MEEWKNYYIYFFRILGDRIMSVNGTSLLGSTHKEAASILSSSHDISEFKIAKCHKQISTSDGDTSRTLQQSDQTIKVSVHDCESSVDNLVPNYRQLDKMGKKYFPFVKKG